MQKEKKKEKVLDGKFCFKKLKGSNIKSYNNM